MADMTKEQEDNSLGAMMFQGIPLAQWVKDLDNRFSVEELVNFIRGNIDLGRLKQGLLDEADKDINDKALFKGEEFFFEDGSKDEDESALAEDEKNPEDVVTVGDFIELLRSRADLNDKLMLRVAKKTATLFDVNSKAGTTVIDIIPSIDAKRVNESEDDAPLSVSDLIDELQDATKSPNLDLALANVEGNPYYITKVVAKKNAVLLRCREVNSMNEGRSWYGGGYGGTGRSYRSLGDRAPRGAEIGWFAVDQIDPKAKGKMPGWRMGPSNFAGFKDLLYPERKYKMGTTVMRNKYVKAGSESGTIYIAIPSYFSALKNNDEAAIKLLQDLGIPLDLTFGMDPNDDYSMTYTLKK